MTATTRLLLLGTGLASFILLGLAQSIFGPVLPVYAQGFGLDIAAVGWLLSLFWAGCLGSVIAVYLWPAAVGPKTGLLLAALGTALMGWMPSWSAVLVGGAVFGAGYGVIAAVYNPRVLAAYGPRGPAMMGLLNAIFTLGAIASPKVFLAFGSDPTLTFALFTGFALLILTVTLTMGDTRASAQEETGKLRVYWPILGFAMIGIGLESSLVGLGPTALVLAGESKEQAAELLSRFFMTYLAARALLVFMPARIPAFPVYLAAMAIMGVLTLLAVMGSPAFWFPFMGFACGLFFQGAFLTGLRKMGASTRVSAIMLTAGLVGAILMPMMISQILDGLGPKGFFQILLGLSMALTVAAAVLLPRMLRP